MNIVRCCCIALVFLAMPYAAHAAASDAPHPVVLNKIAAVVNGEIITLHDLRRTTAAELAREGVNASDPANRGHIEKAMTKTLSMMIEDMLLRQEAERLQIKVSESDVDNEVRKLVQRNQMTMKDFETRLAAQGGTMQMLRERLKNSILSQKIVGIQIARKSIVTSEEVKAYYEAHRSEFLAERNVDVSLIVFAPQADAFGVSQKIRANTLSFEEAAKKFSEGPSPQNGGRLGSIRWEDLAAPLKEQVARMKDGEVSEPFQASDRSCLIKLNSSTSGRNMTLEEATPEIERILREPRLQERFTEYTEQLRNRAVIDIRL